MEHELKIIMKCKEGEPITGYNTLVTLDNVAIGCIQEVKTIVSADGTDPIVEITFPNFRSPCISKEQQDRLIRDFSVDYHIEELSKFPNIKIILKDIFNHLDEMMDEVGTDGHIERCIIPE